MSQSREDYIKFIYEQQESQAVSNKQIAKGLGIAPPSVSEMIHKLGSEDLVNYIPYKGATLTEKGRQMAKDLIRKHEIWEYFLAQKLGYNQQQVHDIAEILEHVTPIDLANRLAKFIDFPEEGTY